MMDIHAFQGEDCTHVLTMHRDKGDDSPVHLVTAKRVEELLRKEVDYDALMARLDEDSRSESK
jgi:hypothetical protein